MAKLIKHRGIKNKDIMENTYPAIKLGFMDDKYVGVEFDVHETKDNEFIIFHNSIYNNKLISNTLYKELPKYIPRLEDILKIKTKKIFLIEIKYIQSFNKFNSLLNKYKNKNIYVMSFSNQMINKLTIYERHYKIGILNYILNTNDDIKKLDFVAILNSLLNDSLMKRITNLEIFSYGIREKIKYENVYYIVDK